jgi:hypothetical protein
LHLQAIVATPDGTRLLRESRCGSDPVALGEGVGALLLAQGAAGILREIYRQELPAAQQP